MPTYEQLRMLMADRERPDREPNMPLLGLFCGLSLALALWSGIAWVVLGILH